MKLLLGRVREKEKIKYCVCSALSQHLSWSELLTLWGDPNQIFIPEGSEPLVVLAVWRLRSCVCFFFLKPLKVKKKILEYSTEEINSRYTPPCPVSLAATYFRLVIKTNYHKSTVTSFSTCSLRVRRSLKISRWWFSFQPQDPLLSTLMKEYLPWHRDLWTHRTQTESQGWKVQFHNQSH